MARARAMEKISLEMKIIITRNKGGNLTLLFIKKITQLINASYVRVSNIYDYAQQFRVHKKYHLNSNKICYGNI